MTQTWIEDDSSVIDVIESAKQVWFSEHSACCTPTDEDTDAAINRALGLPSGGAIRPLADEFADWSADEIRAAVVRGLDAWYGEIDKSAVEFYDSLPSAEAREEYRQNTTELSVATTEQLDAIDAGRKAPCLA